MKGNRYRRRIARAKTRARLPHDRGVGHGLVTWDFSAVKNTRLQERLSLSSGLRSSTFLNRANFSTPNLIVFTPSGVSGMAGAITSTFTTARQVQFGLKLVW